MSDDLMGSSPKITQKKNSTILWKEKQPITLKNIYDTKFTTFQKCKTI